MKKISFMSVIALMVIIASCNNQSADSTKSKEMKDMKMDSMKMDSMKMDSAGHKQHQMMDSSIKK